MPPPTFFARVAYTPRVASPVAVTVNGSRPGPLTVVVPATGTSSGVPSALTVPWSAPGSRPTTLVESTSLAGQTTWRWSGLAVSSASCGTTAGAVAAPATASPAPVATTSSTSRTAASRLPLAAPASWGARRDPEVVTTAPSGSGARARCRPRSRPADRRATSRGTAAGPGSSSRRRRDPAVARPRRRSARWRGRTRSRRRGCRRHWRSPGTARRRRRRRSPPAPARRHPRGSPRTRPTSRVSRSSGGVRAAIASSPVRSGPSRSTWYSTPFVRPPRTTSTPFVGSLADRSLM